KKFAAARQYAFDGVIELARRRRDEGWEVVLSSKVKLAVAPEGKYLLWAGDKDNLQYLVVSDGQNTWTYQPASNRYMQRAAGAAGGTVALDQIFTKGVQDEDRALLTVVQLGVPILSQLPQNPAFVEMQRVAEVNYKG